MSRKILYIVAAAWVIAFLWQTYAHAAEDTPLSESQKTEVYTATLDACIGRGIKDGKSTLPWVSIEAVGEYCKCGAQAIADLVTIKEYNAGIHPEKWPQFPSESIAEKTQCIVFPKCSPILNYHGPQRHQFERCWKG